MSTRGLDDADLVAAGVVPVGRNKRPSILHVVARAVRCVAFRVGELTGSSASAIRQQQRSAKAREQHFTSLEREVSRRSIYGKPLGDTTVPRFTRVSGLVIRWGVGRRKVVAGC